MNSGGAAAAAGRSHCSCRGSLRPGARWLRHSVHIDGPLQHLSRRAEPGAGAPVLGCAVLQSWLRDLLRVVRQGLHSAIRWRRRDLARLRPAALLATLTLCYGSRQPCTDLQLSVAAGYSSYKPSMERPPGEVGGSPAFPLILVSSCKGEARSLRSGYKQLARHLKAARCEVRRLEGGVTAAALSGAAIAVFGGPTQPFAPEELEALRAYLAGGGNLLVLAGEGGEGGRGGIGGAAGSLNPLLESCGMAVAADCVIQTAFTKWVLPEVGGG